MKVADGYVLIDGRMVRGHVIRSGDTVETVEGPYRGTPDAVGVILPRLVNAHTHCADAGAKAEPGMTLEQLVAPPDGLKHRYLGETPRDRIVADMNGYDRMSQTNGIGYFVDFREGGLEGCLMAREACPSGIILGRPVSPEYDEEEVDSILSVADGIALSSISDINYGYAEKVAERTRALGKPFAIHASERIREDIDKVLALEPAFLVHMVEATVPDLNRCRDLDIPVAVCPRSNRFFGKTAPLARMMSCGNTVALGTDNAMLCSPDLRPEAALAAEILRDIPGADAWIWDCLSAGARKLLYRTRKITTRREMEKGFSVLPFTDGRPENAWYSAGAIPSI